MARSVCYRREISDTCSWHQDQSLRKRFCIVQQTGPFGFIVQSGEGGKKIKVSLGDPHQCNCAHFKKDNDLCVHICWLLLKKYKVKRTDPLSYQIGLTQRELDLITRRIPEIIPTPRVSNQNNSNELQQKAIEEGDICPICQEEFLTGIKQEPVTYCKLGCGQNIHIHCMKIWADHQKFRAQVNLECPLCRADFGPLGMLLEEMRNAKTDSKPPVYRDTFDGVTCGRCFVTPIKGMCYKCNTCDSLYLCQTCFATKFHLHHPFVYKRKPAQRWQPAQRTYLSVEPGSQNHQNIASELMRRDLTEDDYELLLSLENTEEESDQRVLSSIGSCLNEQTLALLPCIVLRDQNKKLYMKPGVQCRICLRPYQLGQMIRRIPCSHKFHKDCVDPYLLHRSDKCPICNKLVVVAKTIKHRQDDNNVDPNKCVQNHLGRQQRHVTDTTNSLGTILNISCATSSIKSNSCSKPLLRHKPLRTHQSNSEDLQNLSLIGCRISEQNNKHMIANNVALIRPEAPSNLHHSLTEEYGIPDNRPASSSSIHTEPESLSSLSRQNSRVGTTISCIQMVNSSPTTLSFQSLPSLKPAIKSKPGVIHKRTKTNSNKIPAFHSASSKPGENHKIINNLQVPVIKQINGVKRSRSVDSQFICDLVVGGGACFSSPHGPSVSDLTNLVHVDSMKQSHKASSANTLTAAKETCFETNFNVSPHILD